MSRYKSISAISASVILFFNAPRNTSARRAVALTDALTNARLTDTHAYEFDTQVPSSKTGKQQLVDSDGNVVHVPSTMIDECLLQQQQGKLDYNSTTSSTTGDGTGIDVAAEATAAAEESKAEESKIQVSGTSTGEFSELSVREAAYTSQKPVICTDLAELVTTRAQFNSNKMLSESGLE